MSAENPVGSQPTLSLAERAEQLSQRMSEFKGAANIPDNILTGLGYTRVTEGSSTRLIPNERLNLQVEPPPVIPIMDRASRTPELPDECPWSDEKKVQQPFDKIIVPIEGSISQARRLSGKEFDIFWGKIREINTVMENPTAISSNLQFLLSELSKYNPEKTENVEYMLRNSIQDDRNIELLGKDTRWSNSNIAIKNEYGQEDDTIESKVVDEMDEELERYRALMTDRDLMEFKYKLGWEQVGRKREVQVVIDYLSSLGVSVDKSVTLEELRNNLNNVSFSGNINEQVSNLTAKIKTATSVDEKRSISAGLKILKEEKKRREKLRQGMLDFVNFPQRYADYMDRKFKGIRDFTRRKGDTKIRSEQRYLTLDANYDPVRDQDPGKMSGDCTAGDPLPFRDPDIPVFNIKVLDEDDYLGNIYLLSTKSNALRGEGVATWHLEATQIPSNSIDWNKSIGYLVKGLGEAAEAKGVDRITINSESPLRSNYDYIADAYESYVDSIGEEAAFIEIPKYGPEKYKQFQSTGEGRVVWQK